MSGKVTIDEINCKGCGLCTSVCPKKILEINRHKLNDRGYHPSYCRDEEQCIGCAMCGIVCPESAITVEKE